MYIFFFSYGLNGLFGILISSILMGVIIYKSLIIINKYNIVNYKDFLNIIVNIKFKNKYLNLKNIFNLIINIFILITFFIMIAGFGAYFNQVFNLNIFIGSSILAFFCLIIFFGSIKRFVKINELLIPILIFLIIIIGLFSLNNININNFLNINKNNSNNWILSSIIYCSYNSILLIPILISINNYLKNKKQIILISIFSTIIIIFLSIILFFILAKIDCDISTLEMPIVYIISKIFVGFKYIYGFIIISSIFTTSISLGISFLQNFIKNKNTYTHIAVIMCITSVIISQFGFSNLVNLLYPIFGVLGLIQILIILHNK